MRNIPFHLISKKLIILITSFTLIACQSESGEKTGNSSLNSDPFKKGPKKEDILPEKNNKTLPEINLKDGCNPIMGTDECLLPYPSDVFLVKDSSQVSGFAVKFPEKVKPKNNFGKNMDPNDWLKIDGFSYFPTIVGTFGQEISQEGWVNILDDPNKSINTTESRVLLIRAKTGEPVPHYIDLDSEENILSRQAFIIRPIELLKEKETYIVAIRNVPGPKGKLIEAPKGFKLIRDEKTEEETILNKLKKHYDKKVFPTLESLGWKRSSLQLAWYFTTGSEKTTTRDMFRIRNLTLDFLKNNPPNVTISSVLEHKKGLKWKTIKGTVTGPLFLDSDKPGAELFRNEKGIVVQNRTAEIPFTIEIPRSFKDLEVKSPALVMVF